MKIAVLIKQVPGTAQVEIDPDTGTLKRDGVAAKLNPYDLFALEEALKLKAALGAIVCVVTMGPPQAEAVIREAVYMGCDDGIVLSDRRFAGADVLATSHTLAEGLKKIGFDLIFCGKQTTDGDTAQVGPETAELLGIPHVANVLKIHGTDGESMTLTADMGETVQKLSMPIPALLTFEKDINTPRLPSMKRRYELGGAQLVRLMSLDDLSEQDTALYGANGSPTRVERIFPPEASDERVLHTAGDLSQIFLDELRGLKVI